jgi:hypothetical protein
LWSSFTYTGGSRGAEDGNSSGASTKEYGGPRASSCDDANIFGSRQAPVHLPNSLVFYFEGLLYVLLDYALSLLELDDNLLALGATFQIILINPISWWNIVSLCYA